MTKRGKLKVSSCGSFFAKPHVALHMRMKALLPLDFSQWPSWAFRLGWGGITDPSSSMTFGFSDLGDAGSPSCLAYRQPAGKLPESMDPELV